MALAAYHGSSTGSESSVVIGLIDQPQQPPTPTTTMNEHRERRQHSQQQASSQPHSQPASPPTQPLTHKLPSSPSLQSASSPSHPGTALSISPRPLPHPHRTQIVLYLRLSTLDLCTEPSQPHLCFRRPPVLAPSPTLSNTRVTLLIPSSFTGSSCCSFPSSTFQHGRLLHRHIHSPSCARMLYRRFSHRQPSALHRCTLMSVCRSGRQRQPV